MKNFSHIITLSFILVFLLQGLGERAFSQITYIPDETSKLWIEGRSNINEFECQANQYFAEATIFDFDDEAGLINGSREQVFLHVEIRVNGFECGRSRMNRDLQEALKSSDFPEITFVFDSAELIRTPNENDDAFEIEVNGALTVAGNTRNIRFVTKAYYLEINKVRAIGKTTIKMSDYDVEPPTALMGLIKADDELTVNFDLIASETDMLCQRCPTSQRLTGEMN